MKKLFLTICFLMPSISLAAIRSVSSIQEAQVTAPAAAPVDRNEIFGGFDAYDWEEYIIDRIGRAKIDVLDPKENGSNGVTSVVPSDEALAKSNKPKKNLFQKMYEDALKRFADKESNEVSQPFKVQPNIVEEQSRPKYDFATIPINVPFVKKPVDVVARPHIPYYFSDIEVISTGGSLIEEDIIIVNNKTEPYEKVFNKFLVNRNGEKQKLNLEIISVSINGQEVAYEQVEAFNNFVFKPKQDMILPSGVYEYKFKYVIKNNLAFYDEFDEFLFNVTGINSLLIARAAVFYTIPAGFENLGQTTFMEFRNTIYNNGIVELPAGPLTTVYISTQPILPGGGMYLISAIKKDGVISPDFSKRFWSFFDTHEDGVFSIFGFLIILGAYIVSYKTLGTKLSRQGVVLKKSAPMLRYIIKNKAGVGSLVSLLLELFRKGIVDIIKNDNTILLIKKTDAIKGLNKYEKQVLNELFANKESVLSVTSYNLLKLKRATQRLANGLEKQLKMFVYKLNSRYILFSFIMLFISAIGVASGHIGVSQILMVAILNIMAMVGACLLFLVKTKYKWLGYITKTIACVFALFLYMLLGVFVGGVASFFVLASVIVIFVFSYLFVKRSGLLQNYINEANEYIAFLEKSVESNIGQRDFNIQQASIFALDLSEKIKNKDELGSFYKLDLAQEIIDVYNRKK